MSHSEADSLRDRKRRATAARIAACAASRATAQGLAATTVSQIADDAQVARATFFRYYQTKEHAVAEGIVGPWLSLLTEAIARQPADLTAIDAISEAFTELAGHLPAHYQEVHELAVLTRTSTGLDAWTRAAYDRYEKAIAAQAAARIPGSGRTDPRPRMLAALTMAAIRISLDDWVSEGGELPDLINQALRSITIAQR